MPNTVRLHLIRDKKETEIDGILESIKHTDEKKELYMKSLERTKSNYQEWKKLNKIEGVKY